MAKYRITPSSKAIIQLPISIGHKAEKGVEAIEFDVTAWVETYGSGTLTVIMRRWGDAIPYPIALEIDENNKATWTLSNTDTAKAGMAYAQLSYIVGDEVVKKSDIYTFRVMDSLVGEGEPPEAYESWLEHLTHLAAEAMAEVLDIEGIVTDKTLTVDGGIADAKATGDALSALEDQFGEETDQLKADLEALKSGGLSIKDSVKQALLACFAGVSFEDGNGQVLRTALYNALYETAILSISAVFNPGNSIIPIGADIETLRQYLTVTVHYDDASTGTVTAYTLRGTIESGTSTITVSYEGLTTTFTVTTNAWLFGNIVSGTVHHTHEDGIVVSTVSNRACTSTYLSLNSGDVVGFYNDSDYETYRFAIAPRSGDNVDWSATGGTSGYITSDFTLTVTSDYYYALIARVDNGEIDSTQIEYLNESFGVKE